LGPIGPAVSEKIISNRFFDEFSIFSNGSNLGWRGDCLQNSERGPFHQSLVQIGPVVLEEFIKMQKANDRRPVVAIAHLTLWVR
jgi:hypothetical protein